MTQQFSQNSITKESPKLVGFIVDEVRYGIDIMRVKEVVNPEGLIALPTMPLFIKGVTDHRGKVVPIVNLRIRFGLPEVEKTRRTKWLLVKVDAQEVGLEVDSISIVHRVDSTRLTDGFAELNNRARPWIKSAHYTEKGLLFELDLTSLLDFELLASIIEEGES